MNTIRATLVALLLLALMAVPALAGGGEPGTANGDGMFADVTVSTNCNETPKSVTVTNDSDFPIEVLSVVVADDNFDMEDPMEGVGEPIVEEDELAPGESATYSAPDEEARNFAVFLAAVDAETGVEEAEKATVVFVGCIEVDETFEMPGMPQTGAGGMSGAPLPLAPAGAWLSLLAAASYAILRHR